MEDRIRKVFFSVLSFLVKRKYQRNHAKGEVGVIRRTKDKLLSLLINPSPFGIPHTPLGKRGKPPKRGAGTAAKLTFVGTGTDGKAV